MKKQRKSQKKRATSKHATPKRPGDNFRLPPGVSSSKEQLADGWAYVFRHRELGLLGRIVLHAFAGGNTHVSLELAGDPDDLMTAERAEIFKPLAEELTQRLEAQGGSMEVPPSMKPPLAPPPSSGEWVESNLMQCEKCEAGVALLIFAEQATDHGGLEDYARNVRCMRGWVLSMPGLRSHCA